jgi:UDP-N-acetylglucosamine 1-carboxyvinyltransferase
MSDILVHGGSVLSGTVVPSGNKNSVLPLLCATLLTDQPITLNNVPNIKDVEKLVDFMKSIGSKIDWDQKAETMKVLNDDIDEKAASEDFPLNMFGAALLLGALAGRFRKVSIKTQVKGCSLGMRPLDPHIEVMQKFGAKVTRNGSTDISFSSLKGTLCWTDHQSVTATENAIMIATVAQGTSDLVNAACEPHVQDLCNFLVKMGAKIEGIGSNRLRITGVKSLGGCEFEISSDHHEITTFLALGAMTGGEIRVERAVPHHFPLIVDTFRKLGVVVEYEGDTAIVEKGQSFEIEKPFTENMIQRIEIAPWPYFPVDLMPLMIALSLKAKGEIWFWNKLFYEWGLFWIPELVKLGAKMMLCDQYRLLVLGPAHLKGTTIQCPDIIRATVALVMAAMAAEGDSTLKDVDMIFRAHPDFFEKLKGLGAKVEEVE